MKKGKGNRQDEQDLQDGKRVVSDHVDRVHRVEIPAHLSTAAPAAQNLNAKTAKGAKGKGNRQDEQDLQDGKRVVSDRVDRVHRVEIPEHLSTAVEVKPLIQFRPYQYEPFLNRSNGIEVWCWSRQIGKSYTLAAWAVDRLLTRPGRLVTILSNSQANGQELNLKVAEVCQKLGQAYEQLDLSEDANFESMKLETYITVNGKKGRIRVLAASPRTARGFSGDLILDEFAFHENSQAIWEAAEPIISSNKDFLCRIASTPNGKHNMFYRLVASGQAARDGHDEQDEQDFPKGESQSLVTSAATNLGGGAVVRIVRRSDAWRQGLKIFHPVTRAEITPEQAREFAHDKRAYDQNYECVFADENMALLTYELISQAEDLLSGVMCRGEWSGEALLRVRKSAIGPLFVGIDVGRERDLTVITVIEQVENLFKVRAMLELEGMRLPAQLERLKPILSASHFRKAKFDQTGLGIGLLEFAQEQFGRTRCEGVNFATTVPVTNRLALEGRKAETARVTEVMATEMVGQFEDRRVRIPVDQALRESLRKPERVVTATGRVSIAATRDEAGHADHFWSLALALYAARERGTEFYSNVTGHLGDEDFLTTEAQRHGERIERMGGVLC